MEFFAVAHVKTAAADLADGLTVGSLPKWCESIDKVLDDQGDHGTVYCVWGEFLVNREAINGGVRFTLPNCPNAFSWTVTTGHPPEPGAVVVHGSINRTDHDPDFIETLEDFVEDWRTGLEAKL